MPDDSIYVTIMIRQWNLIYWKINTLMIIVVCFKVSYPINRNHTGFSCWYGELIYAVRLPWLLVMFKIVRITNSCLFSNTPAERLMNKVEWGYLYNLFYIFQILLCWNIWDSQLNHVESIKTTSMVDVSTGVLEKIKNIYEVKIKPTNDRIMGKVMTIYSSWYSAYPEIDFKINFCIFM